jgi:hypothetical protein
MSNEGPEPPAVPEPVADESSNSDDDDEYYNGESSESEDDEVVAAIGEGEELGISREEREELARLRSAPLPPALKNHPLAKQSFTRHRLRPIITRNRAKAIPLEKPTFVPSLPNLRDIDNYFDGPTLEEYWEQEPGLHFFNGELLPLSVWSRNKDSGHRIEADFYLNFHLQKVQLPLQHFLAIPMKTTSFPNRKNLSERPSMSGGNDNSVGNCGVIGLNERSSQRR